MKKDLTPFYGLVDNSLSWADLKRIKAKIEYELLFSDSVLICITKRKGEVPGGDNAI